MGKRFLCLASCVSQCALVFAGQSWAQEPKPRIYIDADETPFVIPAPMPAEGTMDRDLERMRRRSRSRKAPAKKKMSRGEWFKKKKNQDLAAASHAPREMRFHWQWGLVYPAVSVSGERQDYTSELTSHLHLLARTGAGKDPPGRHMWYGIRIAAFSGTGRYRDTPGRYSFLYIGPSVAVGQILGASSQNSAVSADNRPQAGIQKARTRAFWFFAGGVAAQSRIASRDPTTDFVDEDFDTIRWLEMDGTGLWFEATAGNIYWGAFSTALVIGAQAGKGKVFAWAGLGLGGWY